MDDLEIPVPRADDDGRHVAARSAPEVDYQKLAEEVIRLLRGVLTQRHVSERLGYTFNQVGKWESGFTRMKWDEFFRYAEELGVPMSGHFRYSFWTFHNENELSVASTLRALENGLLSQSAACKSARKQIQKWLVAGTTPDLAEVLKLIGTRPAILFGWLSRFVDVRRLGSIQLLYEDFLRQRAVLMSNPLCAYVNAALQLEAYRDLVRHDERLLAEHSACSVREVRETLAILCSAGFAGFDGDKYVSLGNSFNFSGLRDPRIRGFTKHATDLAAERYSLSPAAIDPERTRNASVSSVRVAALSNAASKKIVELVSKFHNDVAEIIASDTFPKDNVQIFVLHSFASNLNAPQEKVDLEL